MAGDMFGIAEENILHQKRLEDPPEEISTADGVAIHYNRIDPTILDDGVDVVRVLESHDTYHVYYEGFECGVLEITEEGIAELGEHLFGNNETISRWVLPEHSDDSLPWWIPEYDVDHFTCDLCDKDVPPSDILKPGKNLGEQYCGECWSEVRERWSPEVGLLVEPPTVEGVLALRDRVQDDPHGIDVEEIVKFVKLDNPDLQYRALNALVDVIRVRPEAVLDYLPVLSESLQSDDILVEAGALYCIADLAQDYPNHVTPLADRIVPMLSVDGDEGYLEGAIPYVSAVADADAEAVLDAVPRLAALLEAGAPKEHELILAISRIAKRHPEEVLPVIRNLLRYIKDQEAENRVAATAAIGYVADDFPDAVSESAFPTLFELLETDHPTLRANVAGVIADLANEFPERVRPAVPLAIDRLDDEDEKARYNATSILAHVADEYPEAVEPAIDPLVEMLGDDFHATRNNACWALGLLRANEAREKLEDLRRNDPDEDVQQGADWALRQIERSE